MLPFKQRSCHVNALISFVFTGFLAFCFLLNPSRFRYSIILPNLIMSVVLVGVDWKAFGGSALRTVHRMVWLPFAIIPYPSRCCIFSLNHISCCPPCISRAPLLSWFHTSGGFLIVLTHHTNNNYTWFAAPMLTPSGGKLQSKNLCHSDQQQFTFSIILLVEDLEREFVVDDDNSASCLDPLFQSWAYRSPSKCAWHVLIVV